MGFPVKQGLFLRFRIPFRTFEIFANHFSVGQHQPGHYRFTLDEVLATGGTAVGTGFHMPRGRFVRRIREHRSFHGG
jgi:fumarate hydratase class II